MCKSVPQMEAVFTRTSTSVGPIKGTATVSICRPFAARTFRSAFIVATIYSDSRPSRGRSFDQFVLIRPVSVCPRLACANFHASISAPRETFITRPPNYFCYSLFVALTSVKSYVHFAQPHGAAYPPQPHRCHLRRCASFPSCRFITLWVMKENSFASRTVQIEEGQRVISTGPYGLVRHPMYFGAVLMLFFLTPALGSWWALPDFLLVIPLIVLRLLKEEKMLCRDLPGYSDYCLRTRYRLLPLLW